MTLPTYPTWMPDPQAYSIDQERYRHDEALAMFGEYAMFILFWDHEDHEQGLVDRCPTCYVAYGKIAETYNQSSKAKCPDCFGTTYEGGYRAKIIRPSLWDATEDSERERSRGKVTLQSASIQSTSDFRLRVGDFLFRGDGTRWQVESMATNHLRTGFDMPNSIETPVGYNFGEVRREEDTSVAFLIPPSDLSILDVPFQRYPLDWSGEEDIVGYLVQRP